MQNVVLDPCVAFSILDDRLRRIADSLDQDEEAEAAEQQQQQQQSKKKDAKKKLANFNGGVVLGRQVKNTYYIRSACPSMDKETFSTLQKLTPNEKFLGWYTFDLQNTNVAEVNTALEVSNPLIFSVNVPTEAGQSLRFRAFMLASLTLNEKGGTMKALQEIECTVESSDNTTGVLIDTMVSQMYPEASHSSEPSRLPASTPATDVFADLRQIRENLLTVQKYVEAVTSGKIQGDKTIGRALAEVLVTNKVTSAARPVIDEKLQDVMMLQHISRIAAQQVDALVAVAPLSAPKKVKMTTSGTTSGLNQAPGSM